MRLSAPERRGAKQLEQPPKRRAVKCPVRAYVHYLAMSGETLAFAVECSHGAREKMITDSEFAGRPSVVVHKICHKLAPGVRLVELPSQNKSPVVQSTVDSI